MTSLSSCELRSRLASQGRDIDNETYQILKSVAAEALLSMKQTVVTPINIYQSAAAPVTPVRKERSAASSLKKNDAASDPATSKQNITKSPSIMDVLLPVSPSAKAVTPLRPDIKTPRKELSSQDKLELRRKDARERKRRSRAKQSEEQQRKERERARIGMAKLRGQASYKKKRAEEYMQKTAMEALILLPINADGGRANE